MRVLFDCQGTPFLLAHGGADVQVHNTVAALRNIGVDSDYLRWWDKTQECDLIHTFSVPDAQFLKFANEKNIPVICTTLFTANCNHPEWFLRAKGLLVSAVLSGGKLPLVSTFRDFSRWKSFREVACNVVGLQAEVDVLKKVHGVADSRIRMVPLGLSEPFLNATPGPRDEDHLITTGTITERKRSEEIAEMAQAAKVPILFVGKPYAETSEYWKRFKSLIDGRYVKHIRHTENTAELVDLMRRSRGYILNSYYENWCLSAHEAIACGLPILVPDQRWSRERFGNEAVYLKGTPAEVTDQIKDFHAKASSLPVPGIKLHSWNEVAVELKDLYQSVLSGTRR